MSQAKHNPNKPISRRAALKLSGGLLSLAPLVLSRPSSALAIARAQTDPMPTVNPSPNSTPTPIAMPTSTTETAIAAANSLKGTRRPFGRVLRNGAVVRAEPSIKADVVASLKWGDVIPTTAEMAGEGPSTYNPFWYQTSNGWIHSSMVQPSENTLNTPLSALDPTGMWGEVTVPMAEARAQADPAARVLDRYYYGCVVRIVEVLAAGDGTPYYRIRDGNGGGGYLVPAAQIRPIPPDELTPISPEVPMEAKRMEVNLREQIATAFENDQPVFTARVATGAQFRVGGKLVNFRTIPGDHRIFMKIPGQRMVGGLAGDTDYYNLPGVSWVSYFTASGIAFHGAYWHNDYGSPRSHGCVNMLPEDAKWVFRWTMPSIDSANGGYTRVGKRTDGSFVKVY